MKDHVPAYDRKKLEAIQEIKDAFNDGKISLEEARKQVVERVGTLKPYEIALAEQELKEIEDDECRKEDIQGMLDIFRDAMDTSRPELPQDHPIMCYYRENDAMKSILLEVEDLVQYPVIKNQWYALYDKIAQFKTHLSRKQNQLYTVLEQKGFDRPTTTMWLLDNFIRDEISQARELLEQGHEERFIQMQPTIVADIRDLMQKEEAVLYPTSLAMITPDEFEHMKEGDHEIGFAWIQVGTTKPKEAAPTSTSDATLGRELAQLLAKHGLATSTDAPLDVATGKLTLEQINLIIKHLPIDITFVDENELVCFYSDTEHRVFPRSKNIIGRDVKNCHPRSSVHIVEEIIAKFRSGEEDHVDFWINKPGFFVYIYYAAVRDEKGRFRGIMEMMQNCTHIRSLEGSRTLLTWSSGEKQEIAEPEGEEEAGPSLEELDNSPLDPKQITWTSETKLWDIFRAYPGLRSRMEEISPKFKALKTPLARVMLPKATLALMSERSGIPVDELIAEMKQLIDRISD